MEKNRQFFIRNLKGVLSWLDIIKEIINGK